MAINTEIKIGTMTNLYSRTERKTPYTGSDLDDFSKCMYNFKTLLRDKVYTFKILHGF